MFKEFFRALFCLLAVLMEDGMSMTTFYYYSVKSSIWFTDKHIFKIIIYFFNTSKCAANYIISFEAYDDRSKDFEAMKAGKLAIRPWLICQYNENTLVDLPSSVAWFATIIIQCLCMLFFFLESFRSR